jgi:hypothetical protein
MEKGLLVIAKWFWPELETMNDTDRSNGVAHVLGFLYATPLAWVGLVWLAIATDLTIVRSAWPLLCLCTLLIPIFDRSSFFLFSEVTPGRFADWQSSLGDIVI